MGLIPGIGYSLGQLQGLLVAFLRSREVATDPVQCSCLIEHSGLAVSVAEVTVEA